MMEVVYIFCESASIRIPFFDYDRHLFRLLLSVGGGVWNNDRQEFSFNRGINMALFRRISSYVPYVQVDASSAQRLSIFGLGGQLRKEVSDNGFLNKPNDFRLTNAGADGQNSGLACDFTFSDHLSLPEKFTEHWQNKLETELRSRKYSPRTRRCYLFFNRLFCRVLQKTPEEINTDDVTQFLAAIEKDREYSASSMNLAISAIKFFYRNIMNKDDIEEQYRPRHDGRLPMVLSKSEIGRILDMEKNPKHRLLLMLVYSSGLRVSEVVALRREHIDLDRRIVYVRLGKGRKDRCTLLSEKAARFIVEYCSFYNVKTWLFPGQSAGRPLSIRSAQYIFDKAVLRAEIGKKISIHSLRHTFATHLLESGTDIRYIQSLLGHSSLRTTERYTHIAHRNIFQIQNPLDTFQ